MVWNFTRQFQPLKVAARGGLLVFEKMLSKDIVKHVARLARLKLTDRELGLFTQELSEILNYIEKLNKLNTEDVKPLTHVLPLSNVLREDEVKKSLSPEKALANAPEKIKGFFSVPKIIE